MHLENASVEEVEVGPLPVEALEWVGELVRPGAVDPVGALEPQPAIVVVAASAAVAVSSPAGRNRGLRWFCIGSPSGLPGWVRSRELAVTVGRGREQLGKRGCYLAFTDDR
jgi:hypothetical protein